jgi:hypothetical protein
VGADAFQQFLRQLLHVFGRQVGQQQREIERTQFYQGFGSGVETEDLVEFVDFGPEGGVDGDVAKQVGILVGRIDDAAIED